jgi:hypothetical protein
MICVFRHFNFVGIFSCNFFPNNNRFRGGALVFVQFLHPGLIHKVGDVEIQ